MNYKLHSFVKTSLITFVLQIICSAQIFAADPVTVVTQFTFSDQGNEIRVAADNNNNAIAVFSDTGVIYATYSANGGLWTTPQIISDGIGVKSAPVVDMDATGTALAIWTGTNGGIQTIESAFFSNGIWTIPTPAPVSSSPGVLQATSVSMNELGQGFAAWADLGFTTIRGSFFSGGTWSVPTPLGTGNNGVSTGYSPNGKAGAVWSQFDLGITDIDANTFNGTVWQGVINLDANAAGTSFPDMGIDANGNIIAVWTSGIGLSNVVSRRFDANTSTWAPAVPLSNVVGNLNTHVAVGLNGTAVAVWQDSSNNIQMSIFNGFVWSLPLFVAPGVDPSVTMDLNGNTLIGWSNPTTQQIFTALLRAGTTTIETPVFISTFVPTSTIILDLALSSAANTGFAVWVQSIGGESENSYGASTIYPPSPPPGIEATECTAKFATQSDRINTVTWTPSVDPNVVAYILRRNGVIVEIVPATGPFIFRDHNRCKNVPSTYVVTSVNEQGLESDPITITIL